MLMYLFLGFSALLACVVAAILIDLSAPCSHCDEAPPPRLPWTLPLVLLGMLFVAPLAHAATVNLSWDPVMHPQLGPTQVKYNIYRRVAPSPVYTTMPYGSVTGPTTLFQDTEVDLGLTHCYRVTADSTVRNVGGTVFLESLPSNEACAAVLSAPINLKVTIP